VEVGKQGRIVIPAHIRHELEITEGMKLGVRVRDGIVELITPETAKRHLRRMFAGSDRSLSEELIAEHHAEAARDAAEELANRKPRARRP
jgi:AbrB family looped-hinge helix DNA binding protein